MTEENFVDVLKHLLGRSPFRAFAIKLFTGELIEVDHVNAIQHYESLVGVNAPGSIPVFLDFNSVSHVVDAASIDYPYGSTS